ALDQVDDVLGDVGRVVGDPLQVADGREHGQARVDQRGRGLHGVHDLLDDLVVVAIDLVVQAHHRVGQGGVQLDEGVQALAHHGGGQVGHLLELVGDGQERRVGQVHGP